MCKGWRAGDGRGSGMWGMDEERTEYEEDKGKLGGRIGFDGKEDEKHVEE